jgi:hypothetical protein
MRAFVTAACLLASADAAFAPGWMDNFLETLLQPPKPPATSDNYYHDTERPRWGADFLEGYVPLPSPMSVPPEQPPPAPSASDYYDYLVAREGRSTASDTRYYDAPLMQAECERRWGRACYAWYHSALGAVSVPLWPDASGNGRALRPKDAASATSASRASGGLDLRAEARLSAAGPQPPAGLAWTTCAAVNEERACNETEPCVLWSFQGASLYRLRSQLVLRAGQTTLQVPGFEPAPGGAYAACASADPETGALQLALNAGPYSPFTSLAKATYTPAPEAGLVLGPVRAPLRFLEVVQLLAFLGGEELGVAAAQVLSGRGAAPASFLPPVPSRERPPASESSDYTGWGQGGHWNPSTPPPGARPGTPLLEQPPSPRARGFFQDYFEEWKAKSSDLDYQAYHFSSAAMTPPADPSSLTPPATAPSSLPPRVAAPSPSPPLFAAQCKELRGAAAKAYAFADPYANKSGALGASVMFHITSLMDELIFASAMLQCPDMDLWSATDVR